MSEREDRFEGALAAVALQLDAWAAESRTGGWSTHQVKPMQAMAERIRAMIADAGAGAATGAVVSVEGVVRRERMGNPAVEVVTDVGALFLNADHLLDGDLVTVVVHAREGR